MKPEIKQKARFSLVYLALAVVVISLIQSWLLTPQAVEIPYSQFLQWIREEKLLRVSVSEREIRGALKPGSVPAEPQGAGSRFREFVTGQASPVVITTTRIPGIEESSLLKELEAHKVEFAGRIESTLVRDLILGWVLPLAAMVGIWVFLMRRVGGGTTQALSFGLEGRHAQDRPVDRRHPFDAPIFRVRADRAVELLEVLGYAMDQVPGERRHLASSLLPIGEDRAAVRTGHI